MDMLECIEKTYDEAIAQLALDHGIAHEEMCHWYEGRAVGAAMVGLRAGLISYEAYDLLSEIVCDHSLDARTRRSR